jgi:phage N-6-adenine-methyltransferase
MENRNMPEVDRLSSAGVYVEWQTPERYIESARNVLGVIDLDPASTPEANEIVKASKFYTKEEDGLTRPWFGNVWLNPPYGGMAKEFVAKLIQEFEYGDVRSAIVLLNANSTETRWWQPLWQYPICFTDHRIKFVSPDGLSESNPTNGSAFVWMGRRSTKLSAFINQFSKWGTVVERATPLYLH